MDSHGAKLKSQREDKDAGDLRGKLEMWWTIGKTVLKAYGLLWMTAVGGFLVANLSAIIGTLFFVPENKSVHVQPWTHTGWYIGIALFFVAAILGKLRFINGTAFGDRLERPAINSADAEGDGTTATTSSPSDENSGVTGFIFACGLAGGFLGLLLGGSLLVFPMSYAYSPFATSEAASSVKVVEERTSYPAMRRNVVQIKHPVTLYLCLTPAVLGVVAGAMGGGVVALKYGGPISPTRTMACSSSTSKAH